MTLNWLSKDNNSLRVQAMCALVFGILGTILGAASIIWIHENDSRHNEREIQRLMAEAWEIMGGRPGLEEISVDQEPPPDIHDALEILEQALALDDAHAGIYKRLGAYYLIRGDHGEAIKNYRRSIQIDPDDQKVAANLAVALARDNQCEEALRVARAATEKVSRQASIVYNGATVHWICGQPGTAEDFYRQALQIDSLYRNALNDLGLLLARSDREAEAVDFFYRGCREYADPEACANYGNALAGIGDHEKALEVYFSILRTNSDHARTWRSAAESYLALDQWSEAIHFLERALEVDPFYSDCRALLVKVLLSQGRPDDARKQLNTAKIWDPQSQELLSLERELSAL